MMMMMATIGKNYKNHKQHIITWQRRSEENLRNGGSS